MVKANPHRRYSLEIYEKIYKWDIENNPGGIFGKIYLRRWSIFIIRLLAPLPVTPNLLTSASLLFASLTAFVLYENLPFSNILGVIFAQICLVLGYADGDMVRLKKLGNKLGGWFDGVTDMIKINIIYFALAIGAYAQSPHWAVFLDLSLLISTRLILAHISISTSQYFANEKTSLHDVVTGSAQKKLGIFLHIESSFLTFSDDVKFFLISLFILVNQLLLGIYVLIIIHSLLILVASFNVWRLGKKEALGNIGWEA